MNHPLQQIKLMLWGSLLGIAIWSLSPHARAGTNQKPSEYLPLPEYEARYVISWHGIRGGESLHKLIKRPDGEYHISSTTSPYLKVLPLNYVEKADFLWINGKIQPKNYYYNIKEGRRHKQGNVSFDWQANKISNTVSPEPWEAEMISDIQDKLTHALSLRIDLMKDDRLPSYTYTVAEDDEIKPYTFTIVGQELLQTNIGSLKTLKVDLVSKVGRRTRMWLSINHDFLPVQVHHFKEGKNVGMGKIKSYYQIDNKKA